MINICVYTPTAIYCYLLASHLQGNMDTRISHDIFCSMPEHVKMNTLPFLFHQTKLYLIHVQDVVRCPIVEWDNGTGNS